LDNLTVKFCATTQPKYKIAQLTHKIAHITYFKIKQILTGEDGPLKLSEKLNTTCCVCS